MMDVVLETLRAEFSDVSDPARITSIVSRLLVAALLGGVLGYERERSGKAAGIRTHMLVAMGAATGGKDGAKGKRIHESFNLGSLSMASYRWD